MAREFTDLIGEAKAAPDIETALDNTFTILGARWRAIAPSDYEKGIAMGNQLPEDKEALIDAIMNHDRVFKAKPAVVEPRETRFGGTPKSTIVVAPLVPTPPTLVQQQAAWDAMTPAQRVAAGQPTRPVSPAYPTGTAPVGTLAERQAQWDALTPAQRISLGQTTRPVT